MTILIILKWTIIWNNNNFKIKKMIKKVKKICKLHKKWLKPNSQQKNLKKCLKNSIFVNLFSLNNKRPFKFGSEVAV